jgi:hypothetical protein
VLAWLIEQADCAAELDPAYVEPPSMQFEASAPLLSTDVTSQVITRMTAITNTAMISTVCTRSPASASRPQWHPWEQSQSRTPRRFLIVATDMCFSPFNE